MCQGPGDGVTDVGDTGLALSKHSLWGKVRLADSSDSQEAAAPTGPCCALQPNPPAPASPGYPPPPTFRPGSLLQEAVLDPPSGFQAHAYPSCLPHQTVCPDRRDGTALASGPPGPGTRGHRGQLIIEDGKEGGALPMLRWRVHTDALLSEVPPVGRLVPPQLTPRNPSLLLVMDSGSRGWKWASMVSVSSLGSRGSSSSS